MALVAAVAWSSGREKAPSLHSEPNTAQDTPGPNYWLPESARPVGSSHLTKVFLNKKTMNRFREGGRGEVVAFVSSRLLFGNGPFFKGFNSDETILTKRLWFKLEVLPLYSEYSRSQRARLGSFIGTGSVPLNPSSL